MHLNLNPLHHQCDDNDKGGKEEKHVACTHCGRQLMERKGVFRRLKPVSNAFVVYGHCLACHSEHSEDAEHVEGDQILKDGVSK